jgi:glycosyltransferase involved in cell wall biosynthesis
MHSAEKHNVIAVIPCLNEELFIAGIVSGALAHVDGVMVIDDGSTDATVSAAQKAGAEVIQHGSRLGAGAATRTGFEAALKSGAEIVVTLDGDGQHNPLEIPQLIQPVIDQGARLVIGSRFLCAAEVPRYRKLGIDLITWMYNTGHEEKITDAQSGFRAYSREALKVIHLTDRGFGFSIQSLVQVRKHGLKIVEVPVSCIYHGTGSSEDPITHGTAVLLSVLRTRLNEEVFHRKR